MLNDWINNLLSLLVYDVHRPLLFNSMFFFVFFLILLVFYQFVIQKVKLRTWYLLVFSLYFYYKTSGVFVLLLVATAFVNFLISDWIYNSDSEKKRKWFFTLSVFWNLGTLGYYKYTNFFFSILNDIGHLNLQHVDIFLPIGISFFTFQTMSYTFDIYRRNLVPLKSFADFCFFVSFFPQLVAGPIVRATDFLPQIHKKISLNKEQIASALFLIIGGLVKKAIIADYVSINFVDRVFSEPGRFSGVENLIGIYGYALQIYCDFSGYSDIAIGLARLIGFELRINFDLPYRSASVTEFWRRWHISLSSWLKDYLYISLGGNRKGKLRQYINLMITMLLGGLWHGASWNFVFWGGIHGIGLVFDKLIMKWRFLATKFGKIMGVIVTFNFVCFAWIFFRAPDFASAGVMLKQIFTAFQPSIFFDWIKDFRGVAILILLGYIMHYVPKKFDDFSEKLLFKLPIPAQALLVTIVIWVMFQVKSSDIQPFIYFQF